MTTAAPRKLQQGMSLLEGLLAVLIFSVGILALVALQSTSVRATTDAKFRADAGLLANQLIATMWTDFSNINTYAFNAGGGACAFAGGGGNANTAAWSTAVQATLPGSGPGMQQVIVTAQNLVTINICWTSGSETRSFSTVTQIQM